MKSATIICFLLLGCNYLLPFNTEINTFVFLDKVNLLFSPVTTITSLNFIYQVTAIVVNSLYTNQAYLFVGSEYYIGAGTVYLQIVTMLVLMTLLLLKLSSIPLLIGMIGTTILSSGLTSVFDAINVHFAQSISSRAILYYATGINISGTLHSCLLIALRLFTLKEMVHGLISYYLITVFIISSSLVVYNTAFKRITHPAEAEVTSPEEVNCKPAHPYMAILVANFFITLFIYPGLLVRQNAPFNLYNEVVVFLFFNAAAFTGNMLAIYKPTRLYKKLAMLTLARGLVGIPPFILFRYFGFGSHPYLSMSAIGFGIILLGLTSGYVASCCFYSAPRTVANLSSKVLVLRCLNLSLSIGLLFGSASFVIFEVFLNFLIKK